MPLGIHVSIAQRIDLAVDRATELGCSGVFQIFTCSPRHWAAKPLDVEQVRIFKEKAKSKFRPVVHMPYMPNLSSPDPKFYSESVDVLIREIMRSSELGIFLIVVHFGSHSGSSVEDGRKRIVAACRKAIDTTPESGVRILLENSAGGRNSVGSKFEQVAIALKGIDNPRRIGVCLDTCHAFASGYDLRTREDVSKTIEEFDEKIGLDNLFLIHANDSKAELGQGADRHEHIGLGRIGDEGFRTLFSAKQTRDLPFVLETPIDDVRGDKENMAHAKRLMQSR